MKAIKSFFIAALMASCMASCDIETSDNGDLDGFWHMERVDTLATGGVCDLSERRVFWSVQVGLVNVTDYDKEARGYLFHFENVNSSLRLYDPYKDNREDGDIKVEDPSILSPYGVNALDETFRIEGLSANRMTLATDELRLSFKKF